MWNSGHKLKNNDLFYTFILSFTGIEITGEIKQDYTQILSYEALEFLADLHRSFNYQRKKLLKKRMEIQEAINAGNPIKYPEAHHEKNWKVAAVPHDLQMRHVEITGPTDRKMVINALNSGADMYMADFEDSLTPSWKNIIEGQMNLLDANRKTISFTNPNGKWIYLNKAEYSSCACKKPHDAASDKFLYVRLLEDKVTVKEHFSTSWFSFKSQLYEMDTFCWSLL